MNKSASVLKNLHYSAFEIFKTNSQQLTQLLQKQENNLPYHIKMQYQKQQNDEVYYPEQITKLNNLLQQQSLKAFSHLNVLNKISKKTEISLDNIFNSYWSYILPYFESLIEQKNKQKNPLFCGVLGVQGAGKSTFGEIVSALSELSEKNVISLSIDDFYLKYEDRQQLIKKYPKFTSRGPPGTHDVDLLNKTIQQLLTQKPPYQIPIFDKSLHKGQGDFKGFIQYNKTPDIVILEGWFVGTKPIKDDRVLEQNLDKLIKDENLKDIEFCSQVNKLLNSYQPVFNQLQNLLILTPEKYEYSKIWRNQAEEKLKKVTNQGLSTEQIDQFVNYFWKSMPPQIFIEQAKLMANLVVHIDLNHNVLNTLSN